MKKLTTLLLLIVSSLTILSCSKDKETKDPVPFTVVYELTATTSIFSSIGPFVSYTTESGEPQTTSVSDLDETTPWKSDTIHVTSLNRPFTLDFQFYSMGSWLMLSEIGSATQNIYIDGNLVKTATTQSSTEPGSFDLYRIDIPAMNYTVQE